MNESIKSILSKPIDSFKRTPAPIRFIREIVAIMSWFTFLTQTLFFDLIGYFSEVTHIPTWLVTYRSLVLLGIIILLWLFIGNWRFIRFIGYIVCYPLVIILWHLPKMCFRNWPVIAAFLPGIISFLRSFRFVLAIYGLSFISAFTIFLAKDKLYILPAIVTIGFLLIVHYYREMKTVLASKTIFAKTADALNTAWESLKSWKSFVPPADIDASTEEGRSEFGSSLITAYLLTAGAGKIAREFRSVAESRKLDIFLLLSWCFTVCLTIVVFAFLYLGIEKISPGSFSNPAGFLSFLGYSLCILTTSDLSLIKPLSGVARIVSFFELGGSISILILMVFLILTSLRDRFRDDFARIADEIEDTAKQFEDLLDENYKLTLQAAEEWLLAYSSEIARHILRLRHDKATIAELEARIKLENNDQEKVA